MAEELPVDLRTRRAPNPPRAPQKRRPSPTPEASLPLRKRRSVLGGGGDPRALGEPPPSAPVRPPPKSGTATGPRAEPPLPFLGPGGVLGVPPPPLLGSPNLGVPPEPPLAAAIAAATRQDEDGDTPLHIAVAQGAVPVARRLVALFLRGGRDLDVYNHLRQTPLHLAVITGQVSLVRLLVSHGASPTCPDRLGRTCAHLACGSHLAGGGGATAGPRPRVLRELLRGPGGGAVDLQARDYEGLTPLHVAVASGSRESVLLLLQHGADVDAGDIKSGRSPLLHAVENDSLEMAELLLQHGASVNAQSYAGCTALHAAAGRGLLRLLRLLLRCGADCGLRNLHNDTAAGVAASAQVIDILRGKASRPPQDPPKSPRDPPHGPASETTPTSTSGATPTPAQTANRVEGAELPGRLAGAQGGPAHQQSRDQSDAAMARPRPFGPQRLRPREGRGQSSINGE
ncbi:B-cell lymphoma 3 protein [Ammospiza caudacuta]|uniref:B-cell lymphoma 3 protein n=1 Tax=Ammospiza caudacuta TaxID=2857398 RepID=UPI0027395E35|nr:B-cell lymphoma 3 protein [Ammospiza caudacuta]